MLHDHGIAEQFPSDKGVPTVMEMEALQRGAEEEHVDQARLAHEALVNLQSGDQGADVVPEINNSGTASGKVNILKQKKNLH